MAAPHYVTMSPNRRLLPPAVMVTSSVLLFSWRSWVFTTSWVVLPLQAALVTSLMAFDSAASSE